MQDLIGRILGQYEIVERLGAGGMASVYIAVQPSLNRKVAIKVLPPSLAIDETFRERFRREATSAAGLQHPNIVPVYDYGHEGDLYYIVMMLVAGGTLKERIGHLPMQTSLKLAGQLAGALDYAHEQNIVHRDVKPANVLMARDDWSLLSDFGIARLTEATGLTSIGTGIGTPDYMSPEQAMGQSVDRRADVYSLGIMLFQMVTGQLPFTGENFSVMRKHVQDPLPRASMLNANVPPVVEAIIDRATQKDPAARYQYARDMQADIEATSQSTPSRTSAIPGSEPTVVSPPRVESSQSRSAPVTSVAGFSPEGAASAGGSIPSKHLATDAARQSAERKSGRGVLWLAVGSVAGVACLAVGCFGLLGLGIIAGNSTDSETPEPTARTSVAPTARAVNPGPTVRPATPLAGRALLLDSFNDNKNGWPVDNENAFMETGRYRLFGANKQSTYVSPNGSGVADVIVDAEVQKTKGARADGYGVIARRNADNDFYIFVITDDGSYILTRRIAKTEEFDVVVRGSSKEIRPGAKNIIRLSVAGKKLAISINGQAVDEVVETKSFATSGRFGLWVDPNVEMLVTRFAATAP